MSWKTYRTRTELSMVYQGSRLDQVHTADGMPPLFAWECKHGHHATIGGSFVVEAAKAINQLLDDNVLMSLETDDEDAIQMVWSRPGMPVTVVVMRSPEDTYRIAMRSSYDVPASEINQAMADIALLADVEHDMEGVIRKAVDAALVMEQRVIDLFRLMEEMHCDAPSR